MAQLKLKSLKLINQNILYSLSSSWKVSEFTYVPTCFKTKNCILSKGNQKCKAELFLLLWALLLAATALSETALVSNFRRSLPWKVAVNFRTRFANKMKVVKQFSFQDTLCPSI